jgi:UDP:flavonoid glycosyltransferase YjiC (YdhE family)
MKWLIPIFCPPTGTYGGLTRVLAIAKAAQAAGHEVRFCAAGDQAAALRQFDHHVYDMPESTLFGLPKPLARAANAISQRVTPPVRGGKNIGDIWLVLFITGYGREGFLRRSLDRLLAIIDDYRPDVLFTDLDPATHVAAEITGLPLAYPHQGVVKTNTQSFAWRRMKHAAESILTEHGRDPLNPEDLVFSPNRLKIIPSIPELDGTAADRPDVCYVGHLLGQLKPGNGFQPEPGKRYVFVYVGTGSVALGTLKSVLPQVFPADGNRRCIVTSQSIKQPYELAGVSFRHYVDAAALLPHCDWTICHGGQNTIAQSLQHGVPLIIAPGALFERRFNAEHVQDCGGGVMLETAEFTPARLRALLDQHADFAPRAAALGERITSYGGPDAAIRAIEAWAADYPG